MIGRWAAGRRGRGEADRNSYTQRRQAAHNKKAKKKDCTHPGYQFSELEKGVGSSKDLAQKEESWIRAGGGPGSLENKIHGQAPQNYAGPIKWP